MLASATVGVTKRVCTLRTCGRTGCTRPTPGLVPAGAGDEDRAAVQVGVDLAGRPAQQLAGRPVAADDLDGGLGEAARPLLDLGQLVPSARPAGRAAGSRCRLEVEGEGALDGGDGTRGSGTTVTVVPPGSSAAGGGEALARDGSGPGRRR